MPNLPLSEVRKVIQKWLYLEDSGLIDIILAAAVANSLQSDPLWLLVIAPPSHTKTELLRAFSGHEKMYFLSNLTPSTLVSGIKPKKNMPDPSLLLEIKWQDPCPKGFHHDSFYAL